MMDRNRANRMTKLRLVARETHDEGRELRKGRARPLGRGWRTEWDGEDFPVVVTKLSESDDSGEVPCEPSTTPATSPARAR